MISGKASLPIEMHFIVFYMLCSLGNLISVIETLRQTIPFVLATGNYNKNISKRTFCISHQMQIIFQTFVSN